MTLLCLILPQGITYASDPVASHIYGALNSSIVRSVDDWKNRAGSPMWLRDSTVELRIGEGFRPSFGFEGVIPLSSEKNEDEGWFFQAHITKEPEESWQTSGGFGWRRLSKRHDRLWGVNVFYDREWLRDRASWGLGVEYFWSRYEARANWYQSAVSPTYYSEGGSRWREEVLGGYDLELGMALPRMPWFKFFVRGGVHGAGTEGIESDWMIRGDWQISPRLGLDIGYGFGAGRSGGWNVQLLYSIGGERVPAMLEKGKSILRYNELVDEDLHDRRFVRVERDWRIHTMRTLIPVPPPPVVEPVPDPVAEPTTPDNPSNPPPPPPPPPPPQPGRISVSVERGS